MSRTLPDLTDPLAPRRDITMRGQKCSRGETLRWREWGIPEETVRVLIMEGTLGHADEVRAKYGLPVSAPPAAPEVDPEAFVAAAEKLEAEFASAPLAEPKTEPVAPVEAPIEPRIVSASGASAGSSSSGREAPRSEIVSPTSVSAPVGRRRGR